MRIELHIDRLVVGGPGGWPPGELVTAITRELRLALARDLAGPLAMTGRPVSVPHLRATLAHPVAGATAASAGQAIGSALAAAVSSQQVFPRAREPR